MDILFIIPPTDLSASYGNLKSFSNPVPSLGLAYMASMLRKEGYVAHILDAYVSEMSVPEIVDYIVKESPPIVGLSILTTSAGICELICREIRHRAPKTIIIGGNLHATLFNRHLLSKHLLDLIVFREGENTIVEVVRAIESGKNLESVPGLFLWKNEQLIETSPRPLIIDLDSLPFPSWDLYDFSLYQTDPRTAVSGFESHHEMQLLGTRGCPNQCTFCSSRTERSLGHRYRMRSPENIVDEIEFMMDRYGSHVFSFMDLAFPLVEKHANEVCDQIILRGLSKKIAWFTECRVKPLKKSTLVKMRRAGCRRLSFGIESCNDRTLKQLRKNFTFEDVKIACKMASDAGLDVDGMFMLGLPGESPEEAENTIYQGCKLGLRFAIFNLFVPYPGCTLYDELMSANKIKFESWSDFSSYWTVGGGGPVFIPQGWTMEGLKSIQSKAMHKFYLSPGFILNQIKEFKPSMIKMYWKGLKSLLHMGW